MAISHPATKREPARSFSAAGFTLIELMVVIAIISVLMSLSALGIRGYLTNARTAATKATIRKINGLLQQRIEAAHRALGPAKCIDDKDGVRPELKEKIEQCQVIMSQILGPVVVASSAKNIDSKSCFWKIVARKEAMRQWFPQRLKEITGLNSAPGNIGPTYGDDDGDMVINYHDSSMANSRVPDKSYELVPDMDEFGNFTEFDPTKSLTYVYPDVPQFANYFRQRVATDPNFSSNFATNHKPHTASGALLFIALTEMTIFGIPPVDDSEFTSSEVKDTDGDGLTEFVDSWGNPLRFYRWPTCLIRPGFDTGNDGHVIDPNTYAYETGDTLPGVGANPAGAGTNAFFYAPESAIYAKTRSQRTFARTLISTLPPATSSDNEPLERDPDDANGRILATLKLLATDSSTNSIDATLLETYFLKFQTLYHTPETYHTFLIVSAGPDGSGKSDGGAEGLGLFEPYDSDHFGHLAAPRFLTNMAENPLNDNITNRN